MKAKEGVGCRVSGAGKEFVLPRRPAPGARHLLLALLACALLGGCAVDERRDVPPSARAVVERVTSDIEAGRHAKVYEEAAPEWRSVVGADDSARMLGRVRERLGRVEARTLHQGLALCCSRP